MHLVSAQDNSFFNQIRGAQAIEPSSIEERGSVHALEPVVRLETESKAWRVAKDILCVVFVLPLVYRGIRAVISWIVVASTSYSIEGAANVRRSESEHSNWQSLTNQEWQIRRFTIEVNGMAIDAVIVSKPDTIHNGRWILHSTGRAGCYEFGLPFASVFEQMQSNLLMFNYPGVLASTGNPHASALVESYQACLEVLENREWGIGATEIIGYGLSLGSGVQAEALMTHEFQENIRYLFIKDQSYTSLVDVIGGLLCRCLGWIVQLFGNNLNVIESSRRLHERGITEIIMEAENDTLMTPEIRLWANLPEEEKVSKIHITYAGEHGTRFPAEELAQRVNAWIEQSQQLAS